MIGGYQGAGSIIVRRSHTAMDSNTVLVGEDMLGLIYNRLVGIDKTRLESSNAKLSRVKLY